MKGWRMRGSRALAFMSVYRPERGTADFPVLGTEDPTKVFWVATEAF